MSRTASRPVAHSQPGATASPPVTGGQPKMSPEVRHSQPRPQQHRLPLDTVVWAQTVVAGGPVHWPGVVTRLERVSEQRRRAELRQQEGFKRQDTLVRLFECAEVGYAWVARDRVERLVRGRPCTAVGGARPAYTSSAAYVQAVKKAEEQLRHGTAAARGRPDRYPQSSPGTAQAVPKQQRQQPPPRQRHRPPPQAPARAGGAGLVGTQVQVWDDLEDEWRTARVLEAVDGKNYKLHYVGETEPVVCPLPPGSFRPLPAAEGTKRRRESGGAEGKAAKPAKERVSRVDLF